MPIKHTTIAIEHNGTTGQIVFQNSQPCLFKVNFPDEKIRLCIIAYLTQERKFTIPESNSIDDYRIELARPTDNAEHFEQALSSLWAKTRVWVRW